MKQQIGTAHVWGIVLAAALLTACFAEAIVRGSISDSREWICERPRMLLANVVILASLMIVTASLARRTGIACVFWSIVALALAAVSRTKHELLCEPLLAGDARLVRQAAALLPGLAHPIHFAYAMASITVLVLAYAVDRIWFRYTVRWRTVYLSAIAACLTALLPLEGFVREQQRLDMRQKSGMLATGHDRDFKERGFFVSLALSAMEQVIMPAPADYSQTAVSAISHRHVPRAVPASSPGVRPHIVVLLSESLFDVTELPTCTFASDPLENLHRLQRRYGEYALLSPGFGGMTANVEFELLTGFSNSMLPRDSFPYANGIIRPIPSVPRALLALGYQTRIIHPYFRWFWSRPSAYRSMGIQQFDAIDAFNVPRHRGDYVCDDACVERMIEELDKATAPQFIMGITMQNHGPYDYPRYLGFGARFQTTATLTESEQLGLQNYLEGVYDADRAIARLARYVENSPTPTVLLVFGDHLPPLPDTMSMYYRLGLISDPDGALPQDRVRLRTTPVLLMSNIPNAPRPEPGITEPNLLVPGLLRMAGIDHPFYVDFLSEVRNRTRGRTRRVCLDVNGMPTAAMSAEIAPVWHDYELLQYDLLYGGGYSRELFAREGWSPK